MRILTLDVETAPVQAWVWRLRDENIGINQVIKPDGLLTYAAKFHGEPKVHFGCAWVDGARSMARQLHALLDEAEAVAGWNSDKFDLRWINRQFVEHGLGQPSPFARVDLMKSVRKAVYLPSYRLDYVARWLGVGQKVRTGGFDLWADVMAGDEKAQALMRRYNIADTKLTEAVYDKLVERGWVRGLPNAAIDGGHVCPHCGGEKLQARGFQHSKTRRYKRWKCMTCFGWSQSTASEPGGAKVKAVA